MAHTIHDFLEIRQAIAGSFAPDASKVLVSANLSETYQLYRVARTGGELTQITDFDEPVAGGYMPTTDELLVQMDAGGNERLQIWMLDDDGANLREVVNDPEHIHRAGGVSRDGKLLAYGSNRRNGTDFDVYVRELVSGEERMVFDMGGWCQPAGFSPDGRYVSIVRLTERNADNDVYLVDLQAEDVIHVSPHDEEASFDPPSWLPDGSAFFYSSDAGAEFSRICRYDMASRGSEIVIEREWDLACSVDWAGRFLRVAANVDGYTEIELYDPRTLAPAGEVPLPGKGVASLGKASKDGRYLTYTYVSAKEPGDAWIYDIDERVSLRLTDLPRAVSHEEFVEPELHRVRSFDGEMIPAFLYRPRNPIREPAPVVLSVHGGPEAQYIPTFNPVIQYLVYRGYAVLAPNVRGSTGYGKRYHHLDDVEKRLDSVRDLAALHGWLPSAGLDPTRAALMGGSYGGYMTLAGLAFQPDLWAAGVDVVGMSNLVTFLENTSSWRRKFREREYGSLERDREFLLSASPITRIDDMRAPLLIIHGTNDPRVPLGEAEQIHAALKAKGVETELLVYPDEGHGLQKLKNRLDAYPKVADFLDRVLA